MDREIVACLASSGLLDWTVPGDYGTGNGSAEAPAKRSLVSFCRSRRATEVETLMRALSVELLHNPSIVGAETPADVDPTILQFLHGR